ncbi:MAG: DeoR/GlpR family DNA-binding transcription regulator [Bacteroidota bacterium]|nr:DeoR/GlpR family DNA-binding transcription regulator [Bacteroidota bacterium]
MNLNIRQDYILEKLKDSKSIQVTEVMKHFNVSDMTVRRDLDSLEKAGLLVRKFGQALLPEQKNQLFTFDEKLYLNKPSKVSICKTAAKEIQENDVIFIDSGTTLFYLVHEISRFNHIRVVTNSLPVASFLSPFKKINLTIIGGEYDSERKALFGSLSIHMIRKFHCQKAFIGSDGISIAHGLSSFHEKEAEVSRHMMDATENVFVLADSTKIEKDAFIKFAPLHKISAIITDKGIPNEISEKYTQNGINIKYGE